MLPKYVCIYKDMKFKNIQTKYFAENNNKENIVLQPLYKTLSELE